MSLKTFVCTQQIELKDDEVKILPVGMIKSQKGNFIVDAESVRAMKETFNSRNIDIVIDYEHQTLDNVQAPAGGWIKDFYLKDDAVVAKVEWTEKAKEYIDKKEYRYLSPVVMVRKSDNKAVALHSVALTNTPAIDGMFTIKNSLDIGDGEMELLKEIIELLGLPEGTTEEVALAKLKELKETTKNNNDENNVVANKETLGLLGLKEGATQQDVTSVIMQLKNPANGINEAAFNELKLKLEKRDADDLVEMAMKEGKITPAQKEWAAEYALKAPDGFKEFLKNASIVVTQGSLDINNKKTSSHESDMVACKMLGVTKEDIEKYGKDDE